MNTLYWHSISWCLWTGTGKTDKIKMCKDILAAIEDHRIDLSKNKNQTTMQYLSGFKRYSTERVMKSLGDEFTQNEKWSVKGSLMGECWYKDCCVSEHADVDTVGGSTTHIRVYINLVFMRYLYYFQITMKEKCCWRWIIEGERHIEEAC